MKVHCPCCSSQVLAANMNLDTRWGKCEICQELFPLADVVPDFPASTLPQSNQRPFNARAIIECTAEQLLIHIPAEGMRASVFGLLAFAVFWLGFIAFWTIGALGVFGGQQPQTFNWLFASFSIPFWLVGFGMLAGVAWQMWGTKSVQVDREGMRIYQSCLGWSKSKWIEFDRIQHAQPYRPQRKDEEQESRAVEIVYRAGSFILPAGSEAEEQWLIAEINDFVKSLTA